MPKKKEKQFESLGRQGSNRLRLVQTGNKSLILNEMSIERNQSIEEEQGSEGSIKVKKFNGNLHDKSLQSNDEMFRKV